MDIVEKLRSQIGDDVQHVFDRDALLKDASQTIQRLRRERDDLRSFAKGIARNIDKMLTEPGE